MNVNGSRLALTFTGGGSLGLAFSDRTLAGDRRAMCYIRLRDGPSHRQRKERSAIAQAPRVEDA
jgi:hypothetical protein